MVHRRLLPRLMNWQAAPKKRLGMTEMKRQNMVKKMLYTLIMEERIKTTNAKAKFVKFYADRVLELALKGTPEAYEQASKLVDRPTIVIPKLFGRMAARYSDHQDQHTRILLNGFRDYRKKTQGPMAYPDAAEMAILEFSDSPVSVSFQLAKHSIDSIREKLAEIEDQLYDREEIQMVDPLTNKLVDAVRLEEKPLTKYHKIKLKNQESFFRNVLSHYQYRVDRTHGCYQREVEYLETMLPEIAAQVQTMLGQRDLPSEYLEAMQANGFQIKGNQVNINPDIISNEDLVKEAMDKSAKIWYTKQGDKTEAVSSQPQKEKTESYFSSFLSKLKGLSTKEKE